MQKSLKSRSTGRQVNFVVSIAFLAVSLVITAPLSSTSADDEIRELATLTGDHQKQQFLAGERVEITNANVADDIFAAGQDVAFETGAAKVTRSWASHKIVQA